MDFGISGRVAMVAAASKGIGFACAEALVKEGCKVSICGRKKDDIEAAANLLGHDARGYACDVSQGEDLERWVSQTSADFGTPQILVTNTGGPPAGSLGDMTDAQWYTGIDSTLMNVVRLTRLVRNGMEDARWGRIVHISSLAAKEPAKLLPISSTLRQGLMALTKLQAWELAPFQVTVNGVLPGHTLTDRQRHLAEVRAEKERISFEEAMKRQTQSTAMKRFADPSEIAAAVAFLCSERASYVSGVSLLVDGATTSAVG